MSRSIFVMDNSILTNEFKVSVLSEEYTLVFEENKIILKNKNKVIDNFTSIFNRNMKLVKNIILNYKLNNTFVILIEINNGEVIQIGCIGISLYKDFNEFCKKTKKDYSMKNTIRDINFIPYKRYAFH